MASNNGEPFSVTAADTSLNTPGSTQRADQVVLDVKYSRKTGPGQSWFDPPAFQPVTEVRFGTAGFNSLRGPGTVNLDLGIFRQFAIGEGKLELRAQAFNATNTPDFNPDANVSNDERVFQFGVRLSF
jgi:hypothetical protein